MSKLLEEIKKQNDIDAFLARIQIEPKGELVRTPRYADEKMPECILVDKYLPWEISTKYPEDQWDSEHMIYDADLANMAYLHRFTDAKGTEYSAIYRAKQEIWSCLRKDEVRMIADWNRKWAKKG